MRRAAIMLRRRGGFTLMELLVAIGVAGITLAMLASAVRTQGISTIFQLGSADMQQNVRGALELFEREVRMAGYGMAAVPHATLRPLEVPAAGAGNVYQVILRGNYSDVASTGRANSGTKTITLDAAAAPWPTFRVGDRVAIESALLGTAEVRTISSYNAGGGVITLSGANLTTTYDPGSAVTQITQLTYRLDNTGLLWRNNDVVSDQTDVLDMEYVLEDGTVLDDPDASTEDLRGAVIELHAERPEHGGLTPQAAFGPSEIRIRNIGIVKQPGVGS